MNSSTITYKVQAEYVIKIVTDNEATYLFRDPNTKFLIFLDSVSITARKENSA
jgi:hypothetical protein